MTQDPIQPLADIGRRVLKTARHLTTLPVPDLPPWSYEARSRDPVVALSGMCGELLKGLAAAPAAAEPEGSGIVPASRVASAPGSVSPTLSRHGEAGSSANSRDEIVYSRPGNRPAERSSSAGAGSDGMSLFEESRRSTFEADSSGHGPDLLDGPEMAASRDSGGRGPRTQGRTASPGPPIARRAPGSGELRHPVERQPAEGPPGGEPPEWPSGEPPAETRADNGLVRGAGTSDVPPHGFRLTARTERLAAMLRSHVGQPETAKAGIGEGGEDDREVFPSRQGDTQRVASHITDESGNTWPGIEEIIERLADELETEFVRTYGSSGG